MGRSDGVLGELRQGMWYSKRIKAGESVLIGDEQERWYSDWTWAVGVTNGLNLDKICEALTYTWAVQMHDILTVHVSRRASELSGHRQERW